MLFQRVSELANKYGLGLADAFHVFYAHGQAEYLITNDEGFLSVWKKDPKVEKETGIIATSSTEFLELCKRHKWL
jgi:predicted nucleic acid-binding protein